MLFPLRCIPVPGGMCGKAQAWQSLSIALKKADIGECRQIKLSVIRVTLRGSCNSGKDDLGPVAQWSEPSAHNR